MIQSLGVNAVGISGKDGGLLNVEKKLSKGEDIGFVGNIKNVNPKVLYDLLENDFLPVVCPVGMDDDFNTYNINADDAACAIAEALNAEKLAFPSQDLHIPIWMELQAMCNMYPLLLFSAASYMRNWYFHFQDRSLRYNTYSFCGPHTKSYLF